MDTFHAALVINCFGIKVEKLLIKVVTVEDIALISVSQLMPVLKEIVQVWKDKKYPTILPNHWKMKS